MTNCAYCGLGIEQRDGQWTHTSSERATCYAQHGITGPRATAAKQAVAPTEIDCPECRRKQRGAAS